MPRSKFLVVLALLLLLTVPATVVLAQASALGEGTAVVFDDAGVSDGVEVSLTGVSAPASGKEYVAWLVEEEQAGFLNIGSLSVGEDGSASLTFGADSDGHTGANLIASYVGWAISVEDAGSSPEMPANQGEVSQVFDSETLGQLRTLIASMADLRTQLTVAAAHAQLAADSDNAAGVMSHARHVVNILEGSGGGNYDSSHGDPGDGTGAVTHAAAAKAAAMAAGSGAEEGSALANHTATAYQSASNAEMWAMMARDSALSAIAQNDIELAKIFIGPGGRTVVSLIAAAMDGFDSDGNTLVEISAGEGGTTQGYRESQLAATLSPMAGGLPVIAMPPTPEPTATAVPTVTPAPTPIQPTAPGLPGVGGEKASLALQLAMLAAASLLAVGGVMSIRGRRTRNRP